MKLSLYIDKKDRNNPTEELRKYSIDIGCPLRSVEDVFDELKINTNDLNKLEGQIIRRCYVDKYGVLRKLEAEEIQILDIPEIELFEGTNYVYILEYTNLNMKIEYLTNAEMNKYFATKMEMNSTIQQTYDSIMLSVSRKVGDEEIISKINMSPEEITILANKLGLTAKDVLDIISGNEINLTSKNITIASDNFNVDKNGNIVCKNINCENGYFGGSFENKSDWGQLLIQLHEIYLKHHDYITQITGGYLGLSSGNGSGIQMESSGDEILPAFISVFNSNNSTYISPTYIQTAEVIQTSKEEFKKNFELLENGLDIIKNTDIYKYHLKSQTDDDKKHIGFVIGENYNYSELITSSNNDGVDLYSMIAVAYQSIKEIVEKYDSKIEKLEARIKELEVK